jgi:hypothetical protein
MRIVSIMFAVAVLAVCGLRAHAQSAGPHVLYQVDRNLPPDVTDHIGQVLASVAEVVAVDAGAQPGDVAVASEMVDGPGGMPAVRLTYYDAVSAAAINKDTFPVGDGGAFDTKYDPTIVKHVRAALASVASNAGAAPSPVATGATPKGEAAPDEGTPDTSALVEEPGERPVAVLLGLGGGAGMHETTLPVAGGTQKVPMSAFPAYDIVLHVDGVSDGKLTPGFHAEYRSSVGYTLSETPVNGVKESTAARTHELRVEGVLNVNFGHSRRDVSLPISFGYQWTNLRTDAELADIHRFTLSGPHLALALRVPISDGAVVLTFGPDAGMILQVSDGLQRAGISPTGLSLGGEAQLLVRLGERFALRLLYREAHASVSSSKSSESLSDVQRFITAGVALTY